MYTESICLVPCLLLLAGKLVYPGIHLKERQHTIAGEHWTTFQTMTEYSSPNAAVVDAAWERYTINGFVTLPLSWAEERHWPAARPMLGDPSDRIYVVDGFHQLHCLVRCCPPTSTLLFIPIPILHLLILGYLHVDVHTRHRLHPRGRRSCPKPHAHSTSPESLLRCVTASHYL